MTTEQKKKYEEAAKAKYSYIQTSIYRVTAEQIAIDLYITGAEEGKKEGWNEAISMFEKMLMEEVAIDYITTGHMIDELQKLRK